MQGDTDEVFFGEGTGGSRSMTLAGAAFHDATDKIVDKARAIAAHMLEVARDDIEFEDGVFSTSKTNRTLTVKEIAVASLNPANLPHRHGARPERDRGLQRHRSPTIPNGCHVCEVEIDRETGETQIVRYSVVDDVGTVINPSCCTARSTAASRKGPARR